MRGAWVAILGLWAACTPLDGGTPHDLAGADLSGVADDLGTSDDLGTDDLAANDLGTMAGLDLANTCTSIDSVAWCEGFEALPFDSHYQVSQQGGTLDISSSSYAGRGALRVAIPAQPDAGTATARLVFDSITNSFGLPQSPMWMRVWAFLPSQPPADITLFSLEDIAIGVHGNQLVMGGIPVGGATVPIGTWTCLTLKVETSTLLSMTAMIDGVSKYQMNSGSTNITHFTLGDTGSSASQYYQYYLDELVLSHNDPGCPRLP